MRRPGDWVGGAGRQAARRAKAVSVTATIVAVRVNRLSGLRVGLDAKSVSFLFP